MERHPKHPPAPTSFDSFMAIPDSPFRLPFLRRASPLAGPAGVADPRLRSQLAGTRSLNGPAKAPAFGIVAVAPDLSAVCPSSLPHQVQHRHAHRQHAGLDARARAPARTVRMQRRQRLAALLGRLRHALRRDRAQPEQEDRHARLAIARRSPRRPAPAAAPPPCPPPAPP